MLIAAESQSPCVAACEELLTFLDAPRSLSGGTVETIEQLRELWQIDKAAYGDCSLEFSRFLDWWSRYECGSRVLLSEGRIVASIGIYPLYPDQAEAFAAGQISESALLPVSSIECEKRPVQYWYCSGIVIVPELQNRGLLRTMLKLGLGGWQATHHAAYPLSLFGLAEYKIGAKLLAAHGFHKQKDASEMPDGCDFYTAQFTHPSECLQLLQKRGY